MAAQKTPKQLVIDRFGDRDNLVKAILKLTEGGDDARSRLMGTTNKKLLRIHDVAAEVQKTFGGKKGLIDAMAKLQFAKGAPNAGWREKMEGFTVKRLLDAHRQLTKKA